MCPGDDHPARRPPGRSPGQSASRSAGPRQGDTSEITRLLDASAKGDDDARDALVALVFAELHGMARSQMAAERHDHTLSATALVSETYLRLFRTPTPTDPGADPGTGTGTGAGTVAGTGTLPASPTPTPGLPSALADRRAFFGAATTAMRRILIDHARAKQAQKRGGRALKDMQRLEVDAVAAAISLDPSEFLSLDAAILRLEEIDERAAQVTRLRFFAGLEIQAVAELLGVSDRTVKRDWEFARAWLRDALDTEHNG